MSNEIREQVMHVVEVLEAGTDAEWAQDWHKDNCRLWDPEEGETLEEHLEWCDERPSAHDWLEDALDIEYVIGSNRQFLGARVLVAFGGPNIWVDTQRNRVDGAWWMDTFSGVFLDNLGLHDALEELWGMWP